VLVFMSHLHVNGHDYMEIRLIRLMSIRYQFAVLHQSSRHGLGLRHRSSLGDWPRLVPLRAIKGEAMSKPIVTLCFPPKWELHESDEARGNFIT
jgi:hypothetical protein